MQILDGRSIAQSILDTIKQKIAKRHITPGLAVILIGDDPASQNYVSNKEKRAKEIGVLFEKYLFPTDVNEEKIIKTIAQLNERSCIHGIIIQLPLPESLDAERLYQLVNPRKDVDGFHPQTIFESPIAMGIWRLLEETKINILETRIVIVGKGKTAGRPIINLLQKKGLVPVIVDTKTPNPAEILKSADVIISTVGKPRIITGKKIKKGALIIDAGTFRQEDGSFVGDVDAETVAPLAGWLSPVPGGVGPMTVAYLLKNTLTAAISPHSGV